MGTKPSWVCAVFALFLSCSLQGESSPGDAFWAASNGPLGGVVNALLVFNFSVYAGTDRGLYKSVDGGVSWRLTSVPLSSKVLSLAAVDHVILAGTEADGILRSVNGID